MTSNYAKAFELRKAMELLDGAHAILQATLGDTDDMHRVECMWEELEEVLKEYCDSLIEMQITD